MRILVVEDDVHIAGMLAESLRNCQYVVDIALDGEMAWNYVKTLEYNLILLDVTLPKLNGIHVCQRLRQCQTNQYFQHHTQELLSQNNP